jgi:SAM-dependent methyltransferase
VDIGGGSGGTTSSLGWDPSRLLLTEGNVDLAAVASTRHAIQTTVADVGALPIRQASAAVVTMLDVIEHLDDPVAALREARGILATSGRLIVSVPAHAWLWSDADVTLGHRRRYSRKALRDELAAAGFEVEHLTHVFSWLVPAVWLVRRRTSGEAALGLGHRSALIDLVALVLTRIEITIVRFVPLPFGTTVLAVAQPQRR